MPRWKAVTSDGIRGEKFTGESKEKVYITTMSCGF